jgi:hypothetical protein
MGVVIIDPILQSGKLRLREIQKIAQVLLASEGWSWAWAQDSGVEKPKSNSSLCPGRRHQEVLEGSGRL